MQKTLRTSQSVPPSGNAFKSPRILKSPRAVKKQPTILQTVFEKSLCLTDKDIPWPKRTEQYGKRIMGSFSLGQALTLLRVVYYNRDYFQPSYFLDFTSEKPSLETEHCSVRDYMTKEVIYDSRKMPIVFEFKESFRSTLEWIKKQGLRYMLLCERVGKTFLGDPDLSDWAYLMVYPDMDVLETNSGYLSSIWKSNVVVKCVDDSKHQQWYDRVKVCFQLGIATPVIICSLYRKSDYYVVTTKETQVKPEFVCRNPIEYATLKPVLTQQELVLETKFATLLNWTHHHKLQWTLGLENQQQQQQNKNIEGEEDTISDTAYFMVWPSSPFNLNEIKRQKDAM